MTAPTTPTSNPPAGGDAAATPDPSRQDERRAAFAPIRRLVVKVGSRLLAESPAARPAILADDIARLRAARKLEVVVVSSGAIALGNRALGNTRRPTELPALQAAAAVGQGRLLQHWEHAFSVHGLLIGQLLLTHDDIGDRKRFLNARHTLQALLAAGVVPIINENDSVAVEEIKYGDNDLLAALVCNLISADALVVLTDVDGLTDLDGRRIPLVRDIEREAMPVVRPASGDGIGSGGMVSKVQAARAACQSGVLTVVAPGRRPHVLSDVLDGVDLGTLFWPEAPRLSSRKHWIAYAGKPVGRILVDEGAHRALVDHGRSLLPAGVLRVEGQFDMGDVVTLATAGEIAFARGLAGYRADDIRLIIGLHSADIQPTLGYKYLDAVVHRDDLVLL
jgi:glutamate 5-kinase